MIKKSHQTLIIIFCLIFCLSALLSGLKYPFGYGFWNAHGHDALWHLAVANQSLNSLPPQNPVFSGHLLKGYHWGYDLLLQLAHVITTIPTINLYFQIFPLIISGLIAYFSYKLKKDKKAALFFIFLNFFAGSFGYFVTFYKNGSIGGESLFWSMQSISTLINPPYALSLIILLSGIYFWQKNQNKMTSKMAVLLGIYFGLNTNIKIYGAILTGLAFSSLYLFQKITKHANHKKTFQICLSMAITSILLLILIGPSTSTLVFKPFWFVHSLIDSFDKLYLPKLSSFRTNLSTQIFTYKFPIYLAIEIFSFVIFLIGNMGTRILSFFSIKKIIKDKKYSQKDLLFLFISIFSIGIPTLFVQKGTAWNTIQFFYYFLIIANFYTADFLSSLFKKQKYILFSLIILLTIPTTLSSLKWFISFPPPAKLAKNEIEALSFLKAQPKGIVLTYPYNYHQQKNPTPISLSNYQTTAYVSAISSQITFLEDEMNLDITGYDWQSRRKQVDNFFKNDNPIQSVGMLLNNNISYIYLNDSKQSLDPKIDHQLENIYQKDNIRIYKVLK